MRQQNLMCCRILIKKLILTINWPIQFIQTFIYGMSIKINSFTDTKTEFLNRAPHRGIRKKDTYF